MHTRRVLLLLVGFMHAQFALAQGGAPRRPLRRDSAGIALLMHTADAFQRAPRWTIDRTPSVVVGGSNSAPEHDLTNVSHVQLLNDGTIVTLAEIGSRLLVFGPDGRPQRSLGRMGRGPGELMAPGGLSRVRGDTMAIPDRENRRVNWIVPSKFISTTPLPQSIGTGRLMPAGTLRSGALVLVRSSLAGIVAQDTVVRTQATIYLATAGATATTVATIPDAEVMGMAFPPRSSASLRFGRTAIVVAWDTTIATGSGLGYTIDLRNERGTIRSSIRLPVRRQPVTRAMRDSAVARELLSTRYTSGESKRDPKGVRRHAESVPVADSLPPYSAWFVTPDNTLWVVDGAEPRPRAGAATAFAPDGSIVGRLTWSRPGIPLAFGNDRVVMRELDEDNIVSLGVYRIQRPR